MAVRSLKIVLVCLVGMMVISPVAWADPALPTLGDAQTRAPLARAAPRAIGAVGQALELAAWTANAPLCSLSDIHTCRQTLRTLARTRARGVNPRVEELWAQELGRLESQADDLPRLGVEVVELFRDADPLAPTTRRITMRHRREFLSASLAEGDNDTVISEVAQYNYLFGEDDWSRNLATQARYQRAVARWRGGYPINSSVLVDLWYTSVEFAGEAEMSELPTPGQIVEVFFHGGFGHSTADVENFVRRVQQYADGFPRDTPGSPNSLAAVSAARVAGRAEYLAADFLWRRGRLLGTDDTSRRAHTLRFSARRRGYREDPLALGLRTFLAAKAPIAITASSLLFFVFILLYRSHPGRRWRVRRILRQAVALRRSARPLDSAASLVTAAEALERLHAIGQADLDLLGRVYRQLMVDCLERNRPSEGTLWGEKLLDLPAEHWPPNFAALGKRCGIVVPTP
jgi:hypothetical protein